MVDWVVFPTQVDGPIVAEKVAPVASAPPQGVDSWSQKNVHNWLHKNHLEGYVHSMRYRGDPDARPSPVSGKRGL